VKTGSTKSCDIPTNITFGAVICHETENMVMPLYICTNENQRNTAHICGLKELNGAESRIYMLNMGAMHYHDKVSINTHVYDKQNNVADSECFECSSTAMCDDKQEEATTIILKDEKITISNTASMPDNSKD
jgi:hypothetical protein